MHVFDRGGVAEAFLSLAREESGRFDLAASETLETLQIQPDGLREILINLEARLGAPPACLQAIGHRGDAALSDILREVMPWLETSAEE